MNVEIFSPNEFMKLEKAWLTLEKGEDMTCFQTFEWYKILNKQFLAEKKKNFFRKGIYALVSDENGNPLLIAPLQLFKVGFYFQNIGLRKGFYFIGRQGFSDYLNFIYVDIKKEYLDFLFSELKKRYNTSFFSLENISEKTKSYDIIAQNYNSTHVDSLCMTLPLKDDYNEYYQSMSKSMRQNIRTAFNRSRRDSVEMDYVVVEKMTPELSKQLMEIRAQRLQKKKDETIATYSTKARIYNKCRDALVRFTSVNIDIMNEVENCWCFIAKCNGEIGAFFYSLYKPENKTVYLILAGVDKKYAWYSPGITQLMTFIEKEISDGKNTIETFDMTRGNEKYKYDLKAAELITSQFNFYI